MRRRPTAAALLTALAAALALTGCGGSSSDESAGDLLARAKTVLDDIPRPNKVLH